MEETSKPATKPDDITNGDRNIPHGESVTSSADDDALSGNVQINSIDDSQPASVEKDSAEQIIPNAVDQNEIISKEGKSISSSENISGDVSIVDSAKESFLDAPIAAARSMEVEEPTGNAVTVQDQKSSTGTDNEAANKPSELENMSQAVEGGNEDLSVNHLVKDTSLAVPVATGSTMEVEEPTSKVSSFDTVLDSIASGETAIEVGSKISQLPEKNSACETALAAPAASASSMEVEEPPENVPSTDVVQSPVTSTEFENEATKAEESRNSVDENLMPPPSVAPKAPLVSAFSMEVEGNVASAVTINDQIAEQQLLESEAVQKINSNSLSLLSQYSGSSDSESEDTDASKSKQRSPSSSFSDESEDEVKDPELSTMYRKCDDAILVSDAETMDTNAASSDDDDEEPQSQAPLRTKGEMLIDELPHIEELTITVPETECKAIGIVDSVVAQIVLVQSVPGVELLNLETVLFLDRGKRPLGKIFDVIGQVNCPIYCVLFNSNQEVVSRNITVGMQVYCAPRTEHTSFIILSELMRYKGSDASWMNDNEPPPHLVEYSDDEAEKTAKRNRKKKSNLNGETSSQHSQPDRQQQSHQHHQRQEQQQHHRQQQFQYPYMPRPQFGRPPPNNRGNFYPQQQSGYSWHHSVNNPRYHHPPQYQQRFQQQQQQYQPHQPQQYQHQPPQPQQQQQQFPQFPNTQPGAGYLPNPFAMFGQQPPPS